MLEKTPQGLYSAFTAAPMVGDVKDCLTPEEALEKMYAKMDNAGFFNPVPPPFKKRVKKRGMLTKLSY